MAKFEYFPWLLTVLIAGCGLVFGSIIPDYIHICHRSDPKLTACIRNSVEALRPRLIKGLPDISVPGLDPLKLGKIVIFNGIDTPNLEASLDNVMVRGTGNFQITKLKLEVEKKIYRVGVTFPYLELDGDYKIDAKILATPIKSQGSFYANATGIDGQALLQAAVNEKNHLQFHTIVLKIKITDFNLRMDNLLNDDPILGQAARQLLSTNKEDIIRMATPHIERKFSEILMGISNRITDNLDYDEIFPL